MSYDDFEARKNAEINALKTLRNSFFLLALIQIGFTVVYMVQVFSEMLGVISGAQQGGNNGAIGLIFDGVIYVVYALFVLYFLMNLVNGEEAMESIVPGARIIRHGAIIYAVYILFLSPATMLYSHALYPSLDPMTLGLYAAMSLVLFAAIIFIAIGIWRLGNHYHVSDLKLGAVLLIFFGFIGSLFVYAAFDEAITAVKRRLPPPPAPPWL